MFDIKALFTGRPTGRADGAIQREIAAVKTAAISSFGGPEGDRTLDLTDANRTLSQTELRAQINRSQAEQKKRYEIKSVAEN